MQPLLRNFSPSQAIFNNFDVCCVSNSLHAISSFKQPFKLPIFVTISFFEKTTWYPSIRLASCSKLIKSDLYSPAQRWGMTLKLNPTLILSQHISQMVWSFLKKFLFEVTLMDEVKNPSKLHVLCMENCKGKSPYFVNTKHHDKKSKNVAPGMELFKTISSLFHKIFSGLFFLRFWKR